MHRLSSAIDTSAELVASLDAFNTEHWAIRYPQELGVREASQQTPSRATPKRSYTSNATINAPNRPSPLRSATVIADPDQDDAPNDTQKEEVPQIQKHPLSILALELQLSQSSHAHPTNLATTLAMLGQDTVAQMVSGRLTAAGKHLAALKVRVEDTSSKVLVTGDLNAGKSTLINAILRRELMPVDQQPCTAVFTEVLDAQTHTNGVEEVHALRQDTLSTYDPLDDKTFARFPLEEMERIAVQDDDDEEEDKPRFDLLKVYVNDARSAGSELSFVTNGIVSIALIDAPGLNRDTLSTTAVFTKQPEIDVVVFVASAENHLTLSAKDFLWNAAREKPNVFVVVNKFAGIRDKKRCMRLVGEQIKQLSPSTWAQRDELVHFVDAQNVFADTTKENDDTFDTLENSLRSFVLHKRASTKLAPARHYLLNLLSDLGTLADENMRVATDELDTALAQLDIVKPVHERLLKERDEAIDAITRVEETNVDGVKDTAWVRLDAAVKQIGRGEICVAKAGTKFHPKVEIFDGPNELPPYPGLLGIWSWAAQVKDTMLRSLEYQVRLAEEAARSVTIKGVDEITTTLADRYLPENQRSLPKERVFRPEVMFAKRRNAFAKMQQHHKPAFIVSAVGLQATRNDTITISVLDLFDFERLFPFKSSPEQKKVDDADIEAAGALSVVSLGVGALTMFGSRAVGVRGFVEAVARTCEILGSPSARKWAGPVIGVMSSFALIYIPGFLIF